MKKISAIIITSFAFLFLLTEKVLANEIYTINSYDVLMEVGLDNKIKITESIEADFLEYSHGILRKIPYRNEVIRLDGTKTYNKALINEITVNEKNSYKKESGNLIIKIGDPEKNIIGNKKYIITYNYDLGKDKMKDYDELYYNIIGYEWDTKISNVTFKIVMPQEFDASKLGFSMGSYGSVDNENIVYVTEGNEIKGKLTKTLNSNEGLTVRLELPEGYFLEVKTQTDFLMILAIFLPLLFAGYSIRLWYKYGKDNKPVETVEFYPPENLNSLEVAFMYKGKVGTKDTISLLIYLANKGYIKIAEYNEKTLFSKKKSFKLIKIKEYDGDNVNEKIFMKGLFKKSGTNKEKQEVTAKDLEANFYITLNAIVSDANKKENKYKIFEKNSLRKKINVGLMMIISFLLITVKPTLEMYEMETLLILIAPIVGFFMLFASLSGELNIPVKAGVLFAIIFGMPLFFVTIPALQYNILYIIAFILGSISLIIMGISLKFMPKRNKYGTEMLGKIKGFRNFLETAEKSKLETLVMENPTYFYNILPFTYVLGVSDKWIKKFEQITLTPPEWYEGKNTFNMVMFSSFLDSTYTNAVSAMTSMPSSSTSGGGFSGGGSGGGGGSSW